MSTTFPIMGELRQREQEIRSQAILRSAKGASCAARFPGICNGNNETTVWCHLNGHRFGKGKGRKSHDPLGFHGCSDCHRYYDIGHGTKPALSDLDLMEMVMGAVCDTWVRLIRAKIVTIPFDVERPAAAKTKRSPKPKSERKPIPARKDPWQAGRKIPSRKSETTS